MSGERTVHPADEERIAAGMARELESMTMTSAIQPSEGFADRVMLAIADEPLPQPVRAFGLALLGGHLRSAAAALGDAWRTVSSGLAPVAVRAQALALVLVVLVGSLTVAGGAAVGALGLLGPTTPIPSPSGPPPSVRQPSPSPSPDPSLLPSPEDGAGPSPEASPSDDPSETPEATETSDSHETPDSTDGPQTSTPEPAETDDHSGSGSGSGSDHTPDPAETDDHSGSDG